MMTDEKPKEVLGALVESEILPEKDPVTGKTRRDEDLRPWIENMKSWMRQKNADTERLIERSRNEDDAYLASEYVGLPKPKMKLIWAEKSRARLSR
jgi:hypothetical protein